MTTPRGLGTGPRTASALAAVRKTASGDIVGQALTGSPYSVDENVASGISHALEDLAERVRALRASGRLTTETLRRYHGSKRFEQVAESNAIEGSTLSVGETELAVLKGVTLTGHDPGYVRDAVALDKALQRLAEMAKAQIPTNIQQLKELHELVLEGRPSAGAFRSAPVRISGSQHHPPKDWTAVMTAMEAWQRWSLDNSVLPPVFRAVVLHAWLTHVHPFSDGNGRTARAVSNLELVRAGYPPIIIRKTQDRDRYIMALQESDSGGHIGPFLHLVMDRVAAALVGLENAAREAEGYDRAATLLREGQARKLAVWNKSVELLYRILVDRLAASLEAAGGHLESRIIQDALPLDDYVELCKGNPVSKSWAFQFTARAPGLSTVRRLAWIGYRSEDLRAAAGAGVVAPSLFWSKPNVAGYPPWTRATVDAPGLQEMSSAPGEGDRWDVLTRAGGRESLSTSETAGRICKGVAELMSLA